MPQHAGAEEQLRAPDLVHVCRDAELAQQLLAHLQRIAAADVCVITGTQRSQQLISKSCSIACLPAGLAPHAIPACTSGFCRVSMSWPLLKMSLS